MPWAAAAAPAIIAGVGAVGGALASRGGSSNTNYEWGPQQKQMYNAAWPFMQGMAQYGAQNMGKPNMGAPMMGAPPSLYDVPSGQNLMPTQGWYDNISQEVKQGLWEPWNDAANQLQMNMGVQGQLGSPRGGYSGAAGTGLGQLYADAGQQVGMQAWNMTQPGNQAMWQANLGRNVAGYNANMGQYQQNYNTELEAWRYPFQTLPNVAMGNQATGLVSQQGNPWAGAIAGGMQGGLAAYSMFGGQNQTQSPFGSYSPYQTGTPNIGMGNYMPRSVDQWQYSPAMY